MRDMWHIIKLTGLITAAHPYDCTLYICMKAERLVMPITSWKIWEQRKWARQNRKAGEQAIRARTNKDRSCCRTQHINSICATIHLLSVSLSLRLSPPHILQAFHLWNSSFLLYLQIHFCCHQQLFLFLP